MLCKAYQLDQLRRDRISKPAGRRLHDAADDNTIGQHVVIVIVPLAGRPACCGALEQQQLICPSLPLLPVSPLARPGS